METFGAIVQRYRARRAWSQQELARYAKVPYMTVWRIERGQHKYPRMDVAIRLADALGISLDVLCGRYEEKKESEFASALPG